MLSEDDFTPLQIGPDIYQQWDAILSETIDFIETGAANDSDRQEIKSRFLSRAKYLDQIYIATPERDKNTLKKLAKFLDDRRKSILKLSKNEPITPEQRNSLSEFAEAIANAAIREASKFHQDPHFEKMSANIKELRAYA